jgi:class 3 adenylate cyclase/tetratricopeptide (TPR) repeat protein
LPAACAKCGFVNESEEKYCGGCGHPLARAEPPSKAGRAPAAAPAASGGERRQVTVLFADLSGYTELSRQLDAEEVHALLERFFERVDGIVARFGGAVDKHIGDCVMAVFGAPVAHGNDAERAARAALAIQDGMRELSEQVGRTIGVHIGLAAGQVVASRIGSGTHREYTVTGDSVNLASRLTDAAARGTIVISGLVQSMLPPRFTCREAGTIAVKGLAEPVQAWRLIGLDDAAAERTPFVGRQAALAQFKAVLAACRDTGAGQAVVVRGEAGIGKTRVVEEFQLLATRAGFACHDALVLDFGAGIGQDAIRTLVRSLLGLTLGSDAAAAGLMAERALSESWVATERRVYLNDLLDLPQPTALRALYDAMDDETRNRGKRATVTNLVQALSKRQPLLLVVEDVHWADRPTLEHLATLAETVAACPALLVMTTRIEGDPLDQAWRASTAASPLLTIDLGPLRPQEAAALAGAYLDAGADFAQRCIERAAGNPLFLEQLLRHAEQSAAAGVPGSVQSLVQARMDQLEAQDKQALQAASVFGQRFALDALRHLIDLPDYTCAPLVRRFLIRPVGDDFLFAHALIRDAVYDSLLKTRRRELHLRAAAWFAGRDLVLRAEHLDRAADAEAPRAFLEAARGQAESYHNERARALAERGLGLATEPADRFALTCLLGDTLHDLGAMTEARAAYEAALEAAADDRERTSAWLGLAAVKRVTEDLDGAFADLARAQVAAERHGLIAQLARVHFLRGNLYFPRGDIEGCLAEHEKSLRLAREVGSPELEAQALGGLGDAEYVRGRMITAHRHLRRCVELAARHGFGRIEVANLPMAAFTRFYAGELAEAYADSLAAVAAAERVGHQRAAMVACHIVFLAAASQAEPDVASRHVERAIDLSRQLGAQRFEAEGLWFEAEILQAKGRQTEALARIRQALAISRETGMAFLGPAILGGLAHITLDPQERRAALAEGERLLATGSVSHNYLLFYQRAIETALEQRSWSEAERYAQALADYTQPEPLPYIDAVVARAKALAALGRGRQDPDTVEALRRAREQAEAIGWRRSMIPDLDAALASASRAADA